MSKKAVIILSLLMSLTGCSTIGDKLAATGAICDIGVVLVDDSSSVAGTESYRRDQAAAAVETSLMTCAETRLAVFATTISSVDPGDVPAKVEVESTSAAVTGAYVQALEPALAADHGAGSDIPAAVHFAGQLADGRPATVWVVTDGMSTIPALTANPSLVTDTPSAIAAVNALMPRLDKMEIIMVGVGGAASSTPTPPEVKAALVQVWEAATSSDTRRGLVVDLLDQSTGAADRALAAYTSATASRTENGLGEGSWTPVAALGLIPWFRRLKRSPTEASGWVPAGSKETQIVGSAAVDADPAADANQLAHQLHAVRSAVRDIQHSSSRRWLASGARARRAARGMRLMPQVDDAQAEVYRSVRDLAWAEVTARTVEIRTHGAKPPILPARVMWGIVIATMFLESAAISLAIRQVMLQKAIEINPLNPTVPPDWELFGMSVPIALALTWIGKWLGVRATEQEAAQGREGSGPSSGSKVRLAEVWTLVAVAVLTATFLALVRATVDGRIDWLQTVLFFCVALLCVVLAYLLHRASHTEADAERRAAEGKWRRARRQARRAASARPLARYYLHTSKTAMFTMRAQADWDARDAVGDTGLALRAASSNDVTLRFPMGVAGVRDEYPYSTSTLAPDEPRGDYDRGLAFTRWNFDVTLEKLFDDERALAAAALLETLEETQPNKPVRKYLTSLVRTASTENDDATGEDDIDGYHAGAGTNGIAPVTESPSWS